jgi:hypothetical protein
MPTFEEVLTDAPQRGRKHSGVRGLSLGLARVSAFRSKWALAQVSLFVSDFDPKLFRLRGGPRLALKCDPNLLKPFYCRITKQRRQRLFSGGTYGERDLTESAEKVRKRQPVTKRRILAIAEDPRGEELERRLRSLFPELSDLPPQPSLKHLLESRKT